MAGLPVFINCRDRVTDLKKLVAWLERAGHDRITLLDNGSTWEPLLEWYDEQPHEVVQFGCNYGPQALWRADMVPDEWFVYTDPDVLPVDECPFDAADRLKGLLERHCYFCKAGLGLYLNDVPATMPSLAWERGTTIRGMRLEAGAYSSMVDTTFAVYRPNARFALDAIRTEWPYEARHTTWYANVPRDELDDETRYYLEHVAAGPLGSSWATWHDDVYGGG